MSSIKYQAGSPHVYWHSHFQACPLTQPKSQAGSTFSASCLSRVPQVQSSLSMRAAGSFSQCSHQAQRCYPIGHSDTALPQTHFSDTHGGATAFSAPQRGSYHRDGLSYWVPQHHLQPLNGKKQDDRDGARGRAIVRKSTHSSGFHPSTGKGKKKINSSHIFSAKNTALFGSPEGRGLLPQGLVRGQKVGEGHSVTELPRTKCPRQPWCEVPEDPVEILQQPGPAGLRGSRGPCQPYCRRDLERSQDSRQRGPQAAAHGQGLGRRDWLKAGA